MILLSSETGTISESSKKKTIELPSENSIGSRPAMVVVLNVVKLV